MSLTISGIGVCAGVAIGKARIHSKIAQDIPKLSLTGAELERQELRYLAALTITKQQLNSVRKQIPADAPEDIHAFIDSHLLMLDDPAFTTGPIQLIHDMQCNAEWALQSQRDKMVSVFEQMEDAYLRTREDDIDHLVSRILDILMHTFEFTPDAEIEASPHILVTQNLSPADVIILKAHGCVGLITEQGGPTSHTAILARSLNLPAIVGASSASRYLREGEIVTLDGECGLIQVDLGENFRRHYEKRQQLDEQAANVAKQLINKPNLTLDGQAIILRANMELPEDIAAARKVGAQGIGLFRTEYLYLNQVHLPDEGEQLHAYLDIVTSIPDHPVTIRTMDIGNDKYPPALQAKYSTDTNPALGLRALRLCLHEPKLFRVQLKAILRASALGPVRMLLPMLTSPQEVDRTLVLIESIKQELSAQGFSHGQKVPIGGMIEVPSAAVLADIFAKKLDFLSIGTNDLIQYTLAIDRSNEKLSYLYDPIHPAILRMIQQTIDAGAKENIPVSLCGEMAGDPEYTRLLLGMGLKEFSVHPSNLLAVKKVILETSITPEMVAKVKAMQDASSPEEAQALLAEINA